MSTLSFFASAPRGVEVLLARELSALGASQVRERKGGVSFEGDLRAAYAACLWSRLAIRVLLPLTTFEFASTDELYAAARKVDWTEHFDPRSSFAIEVAGRSHVATHTHYAGLKVKDAIADAFREKRGRRPDVDTERPDMRVHLYLDGSKGTLSLDFAGESLHRRGYRRSGAEAPLKENLAAAILVRAGWPEVAAAGGGLLDPLCGSGTLLLEAAFMALDIAPGLGRERYGFEAWLDHKPKLWKELLSDADERRRAGMQRGAPPLHGQDVSGAAIHAAHANAQSARLDKILQLSQADISTARPFGAQPGLVVANPPYGERLGEESEVIKLYSLLGATLKEHFAGWKAAIFTARPELGPRLGLRASDIYSLYNGPLACKLLCFDIPAAAATSSVDSDEFANRLRKNLKHFGKWARRNDVSCYRLYDADLKTYALAVDLYQSDELHVHVQEYAPPKTVDAVHAERRLRIALAAIQEILEVPTGRIHYKLRRPQKGGDQYEKQQESSRHHVVEERGVKLWVNFESYLDTGLFLDHRPMRCRIQNEARGKRFLNLFCYTGTATVHAVKGGARSSLSIDLSNTYLDWARNNLELNSLRSPVHQLLRADCLDWLREQAASAKPPEFDLIFCDPPTFSTSKRMEGTLDIQRDHVELIRNAAHLLAPGGVLYFSTNRQGFKLDNGSLQDLRIEDITAKTLDEDFKRPPPAHRCWKVRR